MPERLIDDDGDGRVDYVNSATRFAERRPFVVALQVAEEHCLPGRSYRWTVDGAAGEPVEVCEYELRTRAEGPHEVRLDILDASGSLLRSSAETVRVRDWLIVSIGDSFASGEGVPERAAPRPLWQHERCHRSSLAGPARVAQALEDADPLSSVTFVHLACSGATISEGLLRRYAGAERTENRYQPPQVDELLEIDGRRRRVDAVLLSIGGNDIHFAPAARFCIFSGPLCQAKPVPFDEARRPLADVVAEALRELPGRYAKLSAALGPLNDRVLAVEYGDATKGRDGRFCSILGITPTEAEWAHANMIRPLNEAVRAAAGAHGWTLVDGVERAFERHGYCAGREAWITTLPRSVLRHGTAAPDVADAATRGALHPNRRGYAETARLIWAKLAPRLYAPDAPPPEPAFDAAPKKDENDDLPVWLAAVGLGGFVLGVVTMLAVARLVLRWRRA